jgi:hypothetical protein
MFKYVGAQCLALCGLPKLLFDQYASLRYRITRRYFDAEAAVGGVSWSRSRPVT